MRTLLGFGSGFGFGDAFLQFLLKDFTEKLLTGKEEEVIEVVEGLAVASVVHDLIAVVEESIKSFDEQVANAGRECGGVHKYLRVKGT